MKSILGHTVFSDHLQVTIFKADGLPESGHLQYSMLVFNELKNLHYLVNWDGYTANRLSVLGAIEHTEFTDDQLLEMEMQVIEWALNHHGYPESHVMKFLSLEGFELKEGTLIVN